MRQPGTTTLFFPDDQGLGRAIPGSQLPTDFDRARAHLDYLPYTYGWVVGTLGQSGGEELVTPETAELLLAHYKVQQARTTLIKDELEAKRIEEDIKSQRSSRVWGAVAGLVGVAGVLVAVIALRSS